MKTMNRRLFLGLTLLAGTRMIGFTKSLLTPSKFETVVLSTPKYRALKYGFLKCKIVADTTLKSTERRNETEYHLHADCSTASQNGEEIWDAAINVGTDNADDLLRYRLAFNYSHAILSDLRNARAGLNDLTGTSALPAIDFLRSDILRGTGSWRDSDVMDGSEFTEPVATLKRLLHKAQSKSLDVYIFGRIYTDGTLGIHDVHMNQGSQSQNFLNNGLDDHNDHNDIWQDGALLVDLGQALWAAYFTAFTKQLVPTDRLGNPVSESHEMVDSDDGSLAIPSQ
jgi:uncharacterized protein YukJ